MPDVINTSLQRTVRNDEVIESELLCRYGFFLCLLLGRYRSFSWQLAAMLFCVANKLGVACA